MNHMEKFKSGFVAIIGRPNTGKSTLINYLASKKIAIVSDKPQTTRHTIRAIINIPNDEFDIEDKQGFDGAQVVLIDTPGFHKPKHTLGEHLNKSVLAVLGEVEVVFFMLDGDSGIGKGDRFLAKHFSKKKVPVIAVINKTDLLSKRATELAIAEAKQIADFYDVIPASALTGKNVEKIISIIYSLLPEGPKYYPNDMLTDQPETMLISERIREKILNYLHEEIPHSVFVDIDEMKRRPNKNIIDVSCIIYTERESQKGILIGKGGQLLKKILSEARLEIESLLGSKIFLETRVKVSKKWRHDEQLLKRMGL